jgi:RNA polymerase sigma-70 factor (ECF subfamily)
MESITSASLLQRLRGAGKPEDWDRFVRLYTPLLFTFARRLGVPEADAADLVQEILATLCAKLPTFVYEQKGRFRGWLWTITRNCWSTWRRQQGQALAAGVELDRRRQEPAESNPIEEAEFRQYVVQRAARLMQAEFREHTWQAFWQHKVHDRPAEEVAAELGMSPAAVYTASCRVLERLREEFADLLD